MRYYIITQIHENICERTRVLFFFGGDKYYYVLDMDLIIIIGFVNSCVCVRACVRLSAFAF